MFSFHNHVYHFFLAFFLLHFSANNLSNGDSVVSNNIGRAGCLTKCGNLNIPYPFGVGSNCSHNSFFNIVCNQTFSPPKAYLSTAQFNHDDLSVMVEVIEISETQVRIKNPWVSTRCYDKFGNQTTSDNIYVEFDFTSSSFLLSPTSNKVILIGCNDYLGWGNCMSRCSNVSKVKTGCYLSEGYGCCQSSIAAGTLMVRTWSYSLYDYEDNRTRGILSFSPCSYAFIGDVSKFTFRGVDDLRDISLGKRIEDTIPIVLDWQIGNQSCSTVGNTNKSACLSNSHCVDLNNGVGGYRCACNDGFQGNPYLLPAGCYDIDECNDNNNPCTNSCSNTDGDYICSCPEGSFGDGRKDGTGCSQKPTSKSPIPMKLSLGLGVGALITLLGCLTLAYFTINNRKLSQQRKRFFKQNGGLLLRQRLSKSNDDVAPTKIFTAHELKKATKNFDDSCILGQGGSGIVYKGVLKGNHVVAIKKSRFLDQIQVEDFINEVFILSQINHRNVVKLLGCCLETKVPLLVYEFVIKGTLSYHIEHSKEESWFSWDGRLRIAIEASSALSYLHSAVSTPIIHRDVKSSNILLDDYYTAKISDFGASRLVPLDQTRVNTLVLGTLGYLDPEYFRTGDLTEKSDVYSFGVVLAELLTGKKPFLDQEGDTLAKLLIKSTMKNTLFQILDHRVRREGSFQQLQELAILIVKCLNEEGQERPKMKEVMTELERIKSLTKSSRLPQGSHATDADSMKHQSDLYTAP